MGRKRCVIPDNFESYCVAVAEGRMTLDEACKELYICRATWYNWKNRKGLSVRAHWEWDENAYDRGIGQWVCSNCHQKNDNLGGNKNMSPYLFVGSKYCPNCGRKMEEPKK
jgi:hypothetical protein